MPGFINRLAAAGGALVRGYKLNAAGAGHPSAATKVFVARIGGEAALQTAQNRFEYRLVDRGGQHFLQVRKKTGFGLLKALFRSAGGERQKTERTQAALLLRNIMPSRPVVQRLVSQGVRPLQPVAPRAPARPAPPPAPALQPLFDPHNHALKRPPASPVEAVVAPPAPRVQAPSPPAREPAAGDKPPLLLKWELLASRKSALELHEALSPSELFRKLADGEITERTYLDVLKRKRDGGLLKQSDHDFWKKHDLHPLADPSTITLETQRALYVRDHLQAELFGDLKPRFLNRLVNEGQISERAYTLILKKQLREKRIDDQAFNVWKNPGIAGSAVNDVARKLASVDLSFQVSMRKHDQHAKWIYRDKDLAFLAGKLKDGSLNEYTYEAILESQKRRGLIDDLDLRLWRHG